MAEAPKCPGDGILSYMDFKPDLLEQGSKYSAAKYEDFSLVVARANQWLSVHPEVCVLTCESVCVTHMEDNINTNNSAFYEVSSRLNYSLVFLRLWLLPSSRKDIQQIGYVEQVPICTRPGGTFSAPEFETVGETMSKLNERLRSEPLPGRVINIETQSVAFYKYKDGIHPGRTSWVKFVKKILQYLQVFRVYYLCGEPAYQELGCADFAPECYKKPSTLSVGEYEPVDSVIHRAQQWIAQNLAIHVTNCQTLNCLCSKTNNYRVDGQCSLSYELASGLTSYVKVLRVFYTQPMSGPETGGKDSMCLTSRAFVPPQVTYGGSGRVARYESLEEFVPRIQAWLAHTGAKVLSVQTLFIQDFMNNKVLQLDPDKSLIYLAGSKFTTHVGTVRLYLDGGFKEPPEGALPQIPEITKGQDDGCIVS